MCRLGAPHHVVEEPEAARVVEAHHCAVVEREDDMVVLRLGGLWPASGDPAGHPEMEEEEPRLIKLDQDVFAAPRQRPDLRARQPLGEHRRKRTAQIRPAQFRAHDLPAADAQRQPAADGFDFGKFRHAKSNCVARATGYCSCLMSAAETSDNSLGELPEAETDFGFRQVAERAKAPLVRAIFDSVAPRYDLMNDLMSAGVHRWWKAEMVRWLRPRPGQSLLDVAGGTGDIARRALPRLGAEGAAIVCDANPEMLEVGRARALDDGILAGIEWLAGDAEALPFADRSFELYTIAFGLRNVTRIARALAEARRVLKPGGRFLCLEFTPAVAPLLQPVYDFYSFQVLPLLGQLVTGNRDAYSYLVESIRRFPPQAALSEEIAAAGLERVSYRNLTGGIAALHSAWRL